MLHCCGPGAGEGGSLHLLLRRPLSAAARVHATLKAYPVTVLDIVEQNLPLCRERAAADSISSPSKQHSSSDLLMLYLLT
jgi:hypothetical protein